MKPINGPSAPLLRRRFAGPCPLAGLLRPFAALPSFVLPRAVGVLEHGNTGLHGGGSTPGFAPGSEREAKCGDLRGG